MIENEQQRLNRDIALLVGNGKPPILSQKTWDKGTRVKLVLEYPPQRLLTESELPQRHEGTLEVIINDDEPLPDVD